jgi:hypothetical protein
MCTVKLPPGGNPIAVNKYININILDITLVVVKSGVCIGTMINLSSSKGRWTWQL